MAKRKSITKSLRFEVFKRDSFTCQYCGKSAPDVVLEVDHIVPVSEGGDNELLNLITSCRDCNRGKGKKLLSDDSAVVKQRTQLNELNDRREQMEMMLEWKRALQELTDKQIDSIEELIDHMVNGCTITENGRMKLASLIRRFGFQEVYTSTEISFDRYFVPENKKQSMEFAFVKIGGVCYNRKKRSETENGNI